MYKITKPSKREILMRRIDNALENITTDGTNKKGKDDTSLRQKEWKAIKRLPGTNKNKKKAWG